MAEMTARNPRQAHSANPPGKTDVTWLIDSGASMHVCNDIRLMSDVHWYYPSKSMKVATGVQPGIRKAVGRVILKDDSGNATILKNVEFVPTAVENLLSVSSAYDDGLKFIFDSFAGFKALTDDVCGQ